MNLVGTRNVEFNAENPLLKVVEPCDCNSVAKANGEGIKKDKEKEELAQISATSISSILILLLPM